MRTERPLQPDRQCVLTTLTDAVPVSEYTLSRHTSSGTRHLAPLWLARDISLLICRAWYYGQREQVNPTYSSLDVPPLCCSGIRGAAVSLYLVICVGGGLWPLRASRHESGAEDLACLATYMLSRFSNCSKTPSAKQLFTRMSLSTPSSSSAKQLQPSSEQIERVSKQIKQVRERISKASQQSKRDKSVSRRCLQERERKICMLT
jgi:hypothetical protein